MSTSYDDVLSQLSAGIGSAAPKPASYDDALAQLDASVPDKSPNPDDWWGQYWGHLTDHASQAYHDASNGGTPSMPQTDPMTLTKLIAGRKTYLDDVDAAGNPDADVDTKDRAAVSARRLARIDQVLGIMGNGPDQPMTDARAADVLDSMPHSKLMASDRYRQVYGATTPDMMSEDQRRAYAKDVITKEANDLPWTRDSILAQVQGAPAGAVMADYGKNARAAQQAAFYRDHDADVPLPSAIADPSAETAPTPSLLDRAGTLSADIADVGEVGAAHLAAGAMGIPATVNIVAAAPPAMLYDALAEQFGGDPHAAQEWVFKNLVDPDTKEAADLRAGAVPDGFAQKLVAKLGDMAAPFALALATRNPELATLAAPADLTALEVASAQATAQLPTAATMAVPGAVGGAAERVEAGGEAPSLPELAGDIGESTIQNTMPMAAGGSLPARLAQGGAAQAAIGTAQRVAAGQPTDAADVASDVALGGAFGAMHVEPHAAVQAPADVAAAREGFASAADAGAQVKAAGAAEGRFRATLDAIGDNPDAKARADWALSQYNEGGKSALWTAAELKHIAETGKSRDEEGYAAAQAATSPEAVAMGVTPESAAQERASEEQAGSDVFGDEVSANDEQGMADQRADDSLPQLEGIDDTALRFSLDHHPESGMPDQSRPAEELEHLPSFGRPNDKHTDTDSMADVGRAYHEIGQESATHQLPAVPPEARSLSDIAAAVAPDFRVKRIDTLVGRGNGVHYQIDTPGVRGAKPAFLTVEPGGRLQLDAARLTEGSGSGSRLYHIVNTFAHRNKLKAAPDDNGLSEVNVFRRTEQQLSSAARTRDTSHLVPDYTQRVSGWRHALPERGNSRAESEFNTGLLAHRAMENAHDAVPELEKMRYNFGNERYEWSDGQAVTAHDFARLAGSDAARASGVGSSSIKRAVWTASLLRERGAGGRPDVLAQTSRERLAGGWRGAGDVSADRILYRLGDGDGERGAQVDRGQAEDVSLRGNDGDGVPADEAGRPDRGDGSLGAGEQRGGEEAEAAPSVHETGTDAPSLAQIRAGNYRKGHVKALGLDISIENERGSTRSGVGPDGRQWSRTLNHHYGYIRGTLGADGDHMDAFLGDRPDDPQRQVFVIDQHNPDGGFDEHKVMLGFRNQRAAEQAYQSEYPKGWQGMQRVRAMSAPEFKTWVKGAGREEAHTGPVDDGVPRVTLRHQQQDADVVHASVPAEGTTAGASRADLPRLDLNNAGLPSQRRVEFDEVPRGGKAPEGHSSAVLRNVYDLGRDPRNLRDRARTELEKRELPVDEDHLMNEVERQVVANGFDGYRHDGKVTVLGHDVPVHRPGAEPPRAESSKPAYKGEGMSKSAAHGLVKLLKWNGAHERIEVHQTIDDVPAELRDKIAPEFRDRVHGFYDPATGKAHVIADKMSSPKELYRTLTEEHLGHGGLRKVFNARDLNEMLDRAWGAIPKNERAEIARDYGLSPTRPEHRREIAEEYLAKLEPDGKGKTLFEKFRDWFNSTSRKMGRDVDYSPSELRAIMAAAHDHQRAGLSPSIHSRSAVDLVTPRNSLDGGYKLGKDGTPELGDLRMRVARQKGTPEQEDSMARTMATPHEDMSLGDRARAWLAHLKQQGWEGAREAWHSNLQGWLDAGNQIKRIEHSVFGGFLADAAESPYKMYNLAKNSHAVMAAVMKLGVPEYRDGAFQPKAGNKGVFEIFRPLYEHQSGKSLMPLWEFYASARRASRLINERNINGELREKNFTQEDINRGIALEHQYPEFKRVADDFDAFNKQLLDLAVDRGALGADEAAAWKAHFYVPFMRAVEDIELAKAPKNRKGSATSNQKIYSRRLTGSEVKVESVFENILANTSYIIDRTYRQEFMNRLRDMGDGVVLHKVPMASRAVHVTNEELARALWKGGILSGAPTHGAQSSPNMTPHWATAEVDKMSDAQKKQWTTIFERVAPRDPDVVPIMTDGKMNYYRVSDPLLLRTIGAMGHDSFGKMIGVLSSAKNAVTWGVTKDPGFMVATWFRDTLINWVGSHTPITPFVDNMKGALASIKDDPLTNQLMMAGVGVAPHYETQGTSVRKTLERKFGKATVIGTVHNAMDFYNRIGTAAEASSRLAIAASILKRGGSMAEAAYQAQDILNYSMRGDYTAARALAATAPFWNAGMQGLYRFMRGAGIANAKAGDTSQLTSFMLRGSALLGATLANIWRNNDDPRYNRLSDDDKDRYWHFFIGDQHFKLPKPFEAGVIFGTMPERIVQRLIGNDTTKDTAKAFLTMVTEEMRLNFLPQIVRQGVEQWANRDTSSWRQIVPAGTADQLPQDQFSPYTSWTAKAIAGAVPEKLPWLNSPQRVEHLTRALAGTMGVYALQGADWLARLSGVAPGAPSTRLQDMPVVKRFYGGDSETGDRSKYEDKLYDLHDTAEATFNSFNEALKRGDTDRAEELSKRPAFQNRKDLDAMSRSVSQIRSVEKQIMQNPFLGPQEKREQLDAATQARIELLDQYGPMLDQLHDQF